MKKHILSCAIIWAVLFPFYSDADVLLVSGTVVHFASVSEGRTTLTAKDDFIQRLSPFDRSARMKVDRAVSDDEFISFVGKNVVPWTKDETKTVEATIKKLQPLLHALPLSFPPVIQLIKTTGAEEGNAAYTRATAIVIPNAELAKAPENLEKLICHELFHILSRKNLALRGELYAVIGFAKCNEIAFPPSLASRKITNPDAPRNDHYIRLKREGRECLAVPILFSTSEKYDIQRGGEFFEYLSFQFLVAKGADPLHLEPVNEDSVPKLIQPQAVVGFFEQVGRNTQYIIHPEEILADNFALLVLGERNAPSPEVLRKMRGVLARTPKS